MTKAYLVFNTGYNHEFYIFGIFKNFETVKQFILEKRTNVNTPKDKIKAIKNAVEPRDITNVVNNIQIDEIYCDF